MAGLKLFMLLLPLSPAPALAHRADAQTRPTATRRLEISAFAGTGGTYTGIGSGRNLDITAGVDLGFGRFFSLQPSVELRGTYPLDKGKVDSQRNLLGGLKLDRHLGRFSPYGTLLFGRGRVDYAGRGFPTPDGAFLYSQSFSNVLSPGAGVDLRLFERISAKADVQFERFDSPVKLSGQSYAKAFTAAVVYHFDFNRRRSRE